MTNLITYPSDLCRGTAYSIDSAMSSTCYNKDMPNLLTSLLKCETMYVEQRLKGVYDNAS